MHCLCIFGICVNIWSIWSYWKIWNIWKIRKCIFSDIFSSIFSTNGCHSNCGANILRIFTEIIFIGSEFVAWNSSRSFYSWRCLCYWNSFGKNFVIYLASRERNLRRRRGATVVNETTRSKDRISRWADLPMDFTVAFDKNEKQVNRRIYGPSKQIDGMQFCVHSGSVPCRLCVRPGISPSNFSGPRVFTQ